MVFMIEDFGAEPAKQCFFISTTELADLAYLTDLCPVRFNGSPFPGILGKESGINPNLGGEKAYHLRGRLLPGSEKTAFMLETLEQDGKSQARCPRFIADCG
jgi:hypothetical protein